jgi:glycosyltransferase involved in cell wall biosynthesis
MTTPLVSVVLPVRNGAAFVADAIESIRSQTLHEFEMLVIDDGSRDATQPILKRIAASDARLRIITQPALGLVAALNRGLSEARARYVARMDADDIAAPERLARQAATLDASPDVAALGSACRVVDRNGAVLRHRYPPTDAAEIRRALLIGNCMIHPTIMLRRAAVLQAGGYHPAFLLCEDFDLWLRLAEHHDLLNLPEPLLDYREHEGQSAWRDLEQRALSELGALAAAEHRRAGSSDPTDYATLIDRDFLRHIGITEAAIIGRVVACALGAAQQAIAAGQFGPARAALDLLLSQHSLSPRTRLHGWLLLLRSRIG